MNLSVLYVSILLLLLLLGLAAAIEYIKTNREKHLYPPPGQRTDCGGFHLHLLLSGQHHNRPCIILGAGAGGYSLEWSAIQEPIMNFARVCSYDRAGYGWSDPSPQPRTPQTIAEELHTLLHTAQVKPPYLLVGHSIGGLYMLEFTKRFHDEVAGLILVDSVHPNQWEQLDINKTTQVLNMRMMSWLSHLGLLRWAALKKAKNSKLPASIHSAYAARIAYGIRSAVIKEVQNFRNEPLALNQYLNDLPLIVLSRTPNNDRFSATWQSLQKDLASMSTNSIHWIAENSDHYIHLEEPQLIIKAVQTFLHLL